MLALSASSAFAGANFDGKSLKNSTNNLCGEQPKISIPTAGLKAFPCSAANAEILSSDLKSAELVCDGATKASVFYSSMGYNSTQPIEIVVSEELPDHLVAKGLSWDMLHGLMDHQDGRVYLPTFALKQGAAGLMDLPIAEELYTSYATHEAAHAINQTLYAHECKMMPGEQQEYLAYVTQLSNLQESTLTEVIARFDDRKWTAFDSMGQINPLMHAFNPQGFAVRSYLYHNAPEGAHVFEEFLQGVHRPVNMDSY